MPAVKKQLWVNGTPCTIKVDKRTGAQYIRVDNSKTKVSLGVFVHV